MRRCPSETVGNHSMTAPIHAVTRRGIAPVPSITQTTGNSSTAFIPSGLLVIIVMSIHTDRLLTLDLI